jgi:hypothetical protein
MNLNNRRVWCLVIGACWLMGSVLLFRSLQSFLFILCKCTTVKHYIFTPVVLTAYCLLFKCLLFRSSLFIYIFIRWRCCFSIFLSGGLNLQGVLFCFATVLLTVCLDKVKTRRDILLHTVTTLFPDTWLNIIIHLVDFYLSVIQVMMFSLILPD